ncbi:MAG: hypothetical protein PGN07_08860 [Aeromicrobium erythreum]
MQQLGGRTVAAWVGLALVVAVLVANRTADPSDGAAVTLRVVVIVGAVVVALVAYQTFSMNPPRTPRVIAAVIGSLLGGASLASAATSAPDGAALVDGPLPLVGLAGVLLGCVALQLEAAARRG